MSVFNGEYTDFSMLCQKIRSRTRSALGLMGLVQCWHTTTCLQISAENVTRKNVFLIFLIQQNRFTISVEGVLLWNPPSLQSSLFDVQSNSFPTLCSKLQIMLMGLPHRCSNRPTPAAFENNFATNGTSDGSIKVSSESPRVPPRIGWGIYHFSVLEG